MTVTNFAPDDKFVIIACDGVWDCFTNQEAVRKCGVFVVYLLCAVRFCGGAIASK